MMKKLFSLFLFFAFVNSLFALEPSQILIIANQDVNDSLLIAEYYCQKRSVPKTNILNIPLGKTLKEQIDRKTYNKVLASAIKKEILKKRLPNEIRCLLTVYGVPIKVGSAGPLKGSEQIIQNLSELLAKKSADLDKALERLNQLGREEMVDPNPSKEKFEESVRSLPKKIKQAEKRIQYLNNAGERKKQLAELSQLSKSISELASSISRIKSEIGKNKGDETFASVDSELSMVLFDDYDLYRWQENELKGTLLMLPSKTLMVSRIDGPSEKIALGLIDKALEAEKNGLTGKAYIDARGMNINGQMSRYSYEYYDKNLVDFSAMLKKRLKMNIVFENTQSLFAPDSCPNTAFYCGWYSVKKYIDAFKFVPGAIGYHIASFEAMDLRNAESSNWCPSMLARGITATLGPVNEPYLHSFPLATDFFGELLDGKCLVEAFYKTNPYNSWQMVLIGDPLYKIKIK
ncbi:MAG: hypothetical protein BWY69_01850 [Planctomycetes bacterium ADurb.Bin401]|nr:MAG: hypothetical protein BWY69_01850 [Planctomycetes bacterium ADurb.Bin401]